MLIEIEKVLLQKKQNSVMAYGDTNSKSLGRDGGKFPGSSRPKSGATAL